MNWRSDDEEGLGPEPFIVTVYPGEKHLLRARNKNTTATVEVPMTNGCLVLMAGKLQQYWHHCVIKCTVPRHNHINQSIRRIVSI